MPRVLANRRDHRREAQRIVKILADMVGDCSPLPPPQIVSLRLIGVPRVTKWEILSGGRRYHMPFAGRLPQGEVRPAITLEVTGCLSARATSTFENRLSDRELVHFCEWAISNPLHPLAISHLPLYAWLAAAKHDSRFWTLCQHFIRAERRRLVTAIGVALHDLLLPAETPFQLPNSLRSSA